MNYLSTNTEPFLNRIYYYENIYLITIKNASLTDRHAHMAALKARQITDPAYDPLVFTPTPSKGVEFIFQDNLPLWSGRPLEYRLVTHFFI